MISKGFVESYNKSCFDGYSPIQKRMKSDLNKNYSQMGMRFQSMVRKGAVWGLWYSDIPSFHPF